MLTCRANIGSRPNFTTTPANLERLHLNHAFPVGERRVSLATPPHVADIIRLQLNDDAVLFKIESIQHHLTMQNSFGHDMEAETHVYLQVIPKSGMEYHMTQT